MATAKKGVDLSNWQASLTDAKILTDAGVEFAILKLSEGKSFADGSFSEKYRMCRDAGIAVGAYVYSHATDARDGEAEAEYALKLLSGKELELPIYLDVEGDILSAGKAALTASVRAFGSKIRAAGYRAGVYASLSPLRTVLNAAELRGEGFSVWCASYGSAAPDIDCDIWQYSNTGRLSGYAGYVDMDRMINDIIAKPPEAGVESEKTAEKRWNAEMSTLCRGFYGTQVELLQLLLGLAPDGIFGEKTEQAVRSFQRACGIVPDGIAGPLTYSKIKETMK